MNKTALVADRRYLKHFAGRHHPERPERIAAMIEMAESLKRDGFKLYSPRAATRDELALCHRPEYVESVARTASMEHHDFDPDTHTCSDTWMTAVLAAGGVLTATEAVIDGEADNAFAIVRPPGHHALPGRAMGFCFFNNIAIAAKWLIERRGLSRVLILDWDVHHGNGTQEMFYASPQVLYMSTHQSPFYPGSGGLEETGTGAGNGFTVNLPLPATFGDNEYLYGFDHLLMPIAHEFKPEFVLISAGFDSHYRDPLGSMRVTEAGFAAMTRRLKLLADEYCGGKLVAVLEGGYDLKALTDSGRAVIEELGRSGDDPVIEKGGPNRVAPIIQRAFYFRDQFCRSL
ncbi:MAG TPA: histone deacetylase [Candidatus Binataceae bacterium]|nr:histone deacetylase [Candidatus Binataceae bacterium]